MAAVLALPRTTIGKKAIMALTGLVYIGFVVGHMYGNLKIFLGQAYFNEYAEGLRAFGAPLLGHLHFLYIARAILLVSIVAHIWAAVSLTRQARAARPTAYKVTRRQEADYASLTMRWGGVAIFFFLIPNRLLPHLIANIAARNFLLALNSLSLSTLRIK